MLIRQDGETALSMRRASVTIKTISFLFICSVGHFPIQVLDGLFVAADAILLGDPAGRFLGPNRNLDVPQKKSGHVMVARKRLNVVFGDQSMRGMAVIAGGPLFMSGMVPALVHIIHDMTVVAGSWIVAQVGSEIGRVQACSYHSQKSQHTNEQSDFHGFPQAPARCGETRLEVRMEKINSSSKGILPNNIKTDMTLVTLILLKLSNSSLKDDKFHLIKKRPRGDHAGVSGTKLING
jgi:hypothetical protein